MTIEPAQAKPKSGVRWHWVIYFCVSLVLVFLLLFYRRTVQDSPTRGLVIRIVAAGLLLITVSLIFQGRTFFKPIVFAVKKWCGVITLKVDKVLQVFPLTSAQYGSSTATNKRMFVRLIYASLTLSIPLSLVQLFLYPVLAHDLISNWLLYWLYLFFGVMLPGTLLIVRYTSWQMDWLAWVTLGWAVGHGLELVSLLVARSLNMSGLFIVWIPVAYLMFFLGQGDWSSKVKSLSNKFQIGFVFVILISTAAYQFYGNSEFNLSSLPPSVTDAWFHIENAVEFRDHAVMQDPRLAGEPFNYHAFSYASADAASLLTGDLLANLIFRYVGLNCVWLVALLMFNTARILFENRIIAAGVGTLIFLLPIDFMSHLSLLLDSGGAVTTQGIYNSVTTVGGYIFLIGLALPLVWFYCAPRGRDTWIIVLMALGGSGSKVMVGPLLLSVAVGMVIWGLIFRWRSTSTTNLFTYSLKTSLIALALVAVPVIVVSIALIFGQGSYSESIKWVYNDFAYWTPMYHTLLAIFPSADVLIRTLWIFTFSPLLLLGVVLTTFLARQNKVLATYIVFAWTIFIASLVPTMLVGLGGFSQLFFIYYGLCLFAILAGYGLTVLVKAVIYRPVPRISILGGVLICFLLAQIIWPSHLANIMGSTVFSGWPYPAKFSNQTPSDLRNNVGKSFVLTDEIRDALSWARYHMSKDDVSISNLVGPPFYVVYSEHRAFYSTTLYTPAFLTSNDLVIARYGWRNQLIEDWKLGKPDVLTRMKQAGITYIFVDRLNGPTVSDLPGLAPPSYENRDFVIYHID